VSLVLEAADYLFGSQFKVERTPSALSTGSSQLTQIEKLIEECAFAIVILDGLRPNVVFEYGMLKAFKKEIILLLKNGAKVDISAYFDSVETGIDPNRY